MHSKQYFLESIQSSLADVRGENTDLQWVRDLPGGDINRAALLRSGNTNWFLKYHHNAPEGMFSAEALALTEISEQSCIRVPKPIAHGSDNGVSWLLLEYLELTQGGSSEQLGEQLAALHSVTDKHFGWSCDNYIGTTAQLNTKSDNWVEFWRDNRLQPQLTLAERGGFGGRLLDDGAQLLACMEQLLDGHAPKASLLHGDLWAGNKAYTSDGEPVIFDPASYYGDRETDIAMTELFGGFGAGFYSAYQAHLPLPDGYRLRKDLYNLYHILNHLNLFGEAYLSRSENMISALLAQVR